MTCRLDGLKCDVPWSSVACVNRSIKHASFGIGFSDLWGYAECPCAPSTVRWPTSDPRRPILISSPSASGLEGSPTTQACSISPRAFSQSKTFAVPLIAGALLVTRNQKRDRTVDVGPAYRQISRRRCQKCRHPAFHVDGTAPVEHGRRVSLPENGGTVQALRSPGGTTSVCPAKQRCGAPVPMRE